MTVGHQAFPGDGVHETDGAKRVAVEVGHCYTGVCEARVEAKERSPRRQHQLVQQNSGSQVVPLKHVDAVVPGRRDLYKTVGAVRRDFPQHCVDREVHVLFSEDTEEFVDLQIHQTELGDHVSSEMQHHELIAIAKDGFEVKVLLEEKKKQYLCSVKEFTKANEKKSTNLVEMVSV